MQLTPILLTNCESFSVRPAIIFIYKLERDFLAKQVLKPQVQWTFIDDIFMVWAHSREEFFSFPDALNSQHETVKFTLETDQTTTNSLDTTVTKDTEGNLSTTLNPKPTTPYAKTIEHSNVTLPLNSYQSTGFLNKRQK